MDCVIVSPDYTLSTEAPYPAALEDCYLALLWMKEHAQEYAAHLYYGRNHRTIF